MKRIVIALIALLAVAGCAAGAPEKNAAGETKLTLLLDWTPNTNHSGIYIAKVKGWYKKAGIDLRIIEPGQDSNATQMLATGKADFAISTEEDVTPAVAQGLPVVSVGAIMQHNTSSLVALRSSGIRRPRDLAGKKYGGFGGQLEKQLVDAMVSCDGGDPSTVHYVQVGNADYRVGLTKKFYDFIWVFDGWEGLQFTKIDHLKTVSLPFRNYPKCVPDWYTPLIATSQRLIKSDPDVVRKFMQTTRRGYQVAMQDPAAATDALMAAAPDLDRKLVQLSAQYLAGRYSAKPADWGLQQKSVWVRMTKFLRKAGLIDKDIDVGDAFTNRFLSP
ncbi:MAG TPA: ABC transporter substrate-binding protein [Mycobacteriales bacterium]|nr:ABC transporter substrate-binding protein [Mycobacteriales bacterium]